MAIIYGIFFILFQYCVALMDIEELQNIHYDIDIHNIPVLLGRPLEKEVLYVNSKFGQRYECQLPDLSDFEKSQEEEKVASEIGIAELLKPMEEAPCLIMTQGWWSYEFCYAKNVKQYHLENGIPQGEIIYLGHYESQMDWSNTTHKDAKRHKLNRYHSHMYVNGTECDLNGKARMAEVRFVCSEGEGDAIVRVNEPESCVYIVTVQTTRICHHPYLRPPPSLKPRPILCYPVLDEVQYNELINKKEENLKKQQDKLMELQEAERLNKIKKAQNLVNAFEVQKNIAKQEVNIIEDESDTIKEIHPPAGDVDETTTAQGSLPVAPDIDSLESKADNDLKVAENKDEEEVQLLKEFNTLLKNIIKKVPDFTDEKDVTDKSSTVTNDMTVSQNTDTNQFYKELKKFRDEVVDSSESEEETTKLLEIADKFEKVYESLGKVEDAIDDVSEEEAQTLFNVEDSMDILRDTFDDSDKTKQLRKSVNKLSKELQDVKGVEEEPEVQDEPDTVTTILPNDQVKVKVTKIKVGKKFHLESQTEVYDSDYRKIEDAVREQLENEGISTEGKVEIKILSFDPREENLKKGDNFDVDEEDDDGMTVLTEEESTYFKNMIFGLLNGDAASKEQKKHRRLESNYGFSYKKTSTLESEDE